ncbi:zinc finger protein 469 [Thomomys bottae]
MPGEQPQGTLPAAMTTDLPLCRAACSLGAPSPHPLQDHSLASGTPQGTRETGSKARARAPPKVHLRQAKEAAPEALSPKVQARGRPPRKENSPWAPPGRSRTPAHKWLACRADSSPPQLYSPDMARPATDQPSEGSEGAAPPGPGPGSPPGPCLPRGKTLPAPEERSLREALSSFTSTNYTSPNSAPGPPPLREPQGPGTSPRRAASLWEPQAQATNLWPSAAENNFQGANRGVPSAEPEPFPESRKPGSPRGGSFGGPTPAHSPRGTGTQALPEGLAGQEHGPGALLRAFHQPLAAWPGIAGLAYPQPTPPAPSCHLDGATSHSAAAHLAPSPFPDSLHTSLTEALPEGLASACDRLGSPRAPPNPLPQKCFAGKTYRTNGVGASPGPLDVTLPTSGPPATRLCQLWDGASTPFPTPTPALGQPAVVKTAFFEDQLSPGQQLCLPQSPPVSWPPVLPTSGPGPPQIRVLNQLPFPGGGPRWPRDSQGVLGSASMTPGPGEPLVTASPSPAQPSAPPGLLNSGRLSDPGAQPLFLGGTQPQLSPQGAPGLPQPCAVGASPSESPLPSPATHTAGSSTCSSLSPPSSSPVNPSSEDSQLPGSLGASAFFHPPAHSQETRSPFPSPEPPRTLPVHYQPEVTKAFPFPEDRLGAEGAFEGLEDPEVGRSRLRDLPRGPGPYFPLSSASLDQLDVLLTCRQCDRNYSSLATFLEHRQFCSPQQAPGLPATTPTGSLSHSQEVPFRLTDGKDDPLRTSLLPGLATAACPLPTSDLDLEDDAKLDSLITEALNGMEYQSDSPELDSSFIDVFSDEEPSGPRGPGTGQLPSSRAGAAPEDSVPSLLSAPAAALEPQAPRPGDRNCPPPQRPKTRSLGLATAETATSPLRPRRRGKQLKLFQKNLDMANSTKGPARVICLRPRRRRGHSTDRVPPGPRDLRKQPAKGHQGSAGTRISKLPGLPPGKASRKRRGRASSWSKEFIHKIVQQKNKRYGPHGQGAAGPLLTESLPSSAPESRLLVQDCASESEEEGGLPPRSPGHRGRPHPACQRGERQKEENETRDPEEVRRQEAEDTEETHSTQHSQGAGGRGPASSDPPTGVPTSPKTLEENQPSVGFTQELLKPRSIAGIRLDTVKPREASNRPGPHGRERPRAAPSSRDRPSGSHAHELPSQAVPPPSAGGLLGSSAHTNLHTTQDREASSSWPGNCLEPVASSAPTVTFFKSSALGSNPVYFSRDPIGVPAAPKVPQAESSAPQGLLHTSKDGAGCFPEDLYATRPLGVDTGSHPYLGSESGATSEPKEPAPPKSPPYAVERDPDGPPSPLTLASTSLFSGLPEDGFDLATNRATPVSLACASPLPRKPLLDPLCPWFLLLEEECPVLSSQLPDLSGERACRELCPPGGTAPPSPPLVPGKEMECAAAVVSDLCEDELEIKRLVTELESQLQRRESEHGLPREADGAVDEDKPGPGLQAVSPRGAVLAAAGLAGLGELSPHWQGALGSPQGPWPCPATGRAASPPGPDPLPIPGPPLHPSTDGLSFQAMREASVPQMERDNRVPPSGCLPDSHIQEEPLPGARSVAKCKPDSEHSFPETNRFQTQSKVALLPSCCPQQGGAPPMPGKAGQPHGDPRLAGPAGHMTPEEAFWCEGDATLPPSALPGAASPGRAGELGSAALHLVAEEPGFEGEDLAPARASRLSAPQDSPTQFCPTQSPAWVPDSGPGRKPWDPASSYVCPLLVMGIRTGCTKDTQGSPGLPPADAEGPDTRDPSVGGRDREKCGSPWPEQRTAAAAVPGRPCKADGFLGLPGLAGAPEAEGEASPPQPGNQRGPGEPDALTKVLAGPEAPPGRLASHRDVCERSSREQARKPPGSTSDSAGAEGRIPETVTGPGLDRQRLHGGERPAAPTRTLDTRAPGPSTSLDTPTPCGLELLPRGGLPPTPLHVTEAPGEQKELLPTLLSCGDPPSSPNQLASPAWVPGEETNCVQAPTNHPLSLTSLSGAPTEEGTEGTGGLVVPDPHFSTASPPTTTGWMPPGPASGPPGSAPHAGCSGGCPALSGTTGLDTCLEDEEEDTGTPGATHSVMEVPGAGTRSPTAGSSPKGLAQDASPSGPPQSHIRVPQKPLSPKRRPRGFKRKAEPVEQGQGKGQVPTRPPVTCEVCAAPFCTTAGLSRHKARKHRPGELTSPPGPAGLPAPWPLEPTTQTCRAPRKRSRKAPAKTRPSSLSTDPSQPPGPSPTLDPTAPTDIPGLETSTAAQRGTLRGPLRQKQHLSGSAEQGKGVRALASKFGSPEKLEAKPHPRRMDQREGQRPGGQPSGAVHNAERKWKKQAGALRARRLRRTRSPQASADVTADGAHSGPPIATGHRPVSGHVPLEGQLPCSNTQSLDGVADRGLGPPSTQRSPRGRLEGTSLRERTAGQKGVMAGQSDSVEARDLSIDSKLLQAAGSPREDSSGARGGLPEGTAPPDVSGSAAGSSADQSLLATPDTGGGVQGPEDTATEAPSPGPGDTLSTLEDEVSFSQLSPLGGRLARKKNPRVYGKCCKRSEPPAPPGQPPPTVPTGTHAHVPSSPRLPTDLSDSGSLCLSREDLWDDEAMGLPESFFMDGLLTQVPGLDPWAPSLSLWSLEPSREASWAEEEPSHCPEEEDEWAEAIPQLHMVPAAWRGLELRAADETPSPCGDVSPEPPNLEREHTGDELPGDTSLLPLHTKDLEALSTQLEMRDLRFLGSCEGLSGLLSPHFVDSQGPQSGKREEVAGAGRGAGGGKAPYKCPLCFQCFGGPGELDLHTLAHSPPPPPTCYMCVQRRFRSRELLLQHLREKHGQAREGPWACGMCLEEAADVWVHNQHLGEHAARFAQQGRPLPPLGNLPPCLREDAAFPRLLNSIMEHTSRSPGGPGEASEPEGEAEETPRGRGTPGPGSTSSGHCSALTPPRASLSALTGTSATVSGPAQMSPSLSPDPWSHSEHLIQASLVHEDCRNPSRDCHHCGKPFPKPFKLQRHLAVHSPQRVYLCPRCPRAYAQHGELRAHLCGEHGARGERELPHTPLYTCELCAHVMHVIRRSFICSSCNYTFAKKEQFDRHMDKHLRSGQKPFALRGARRPGAPGQKGAPGWKTSALEGALPRKRCRMASPSGQPGPSSTDQPLSPASPALSEASLLFLSQIFLEVDSSTTKGQPKTQERPPDPSSLEGHPVKEADLPSDSHGPLPPPLSPFPDSLAEGGGGRLEPALQPPRDETPAGGPGPKKQRSTLKGKRAPPTHPRAHPFSGRRTNPATPRGPGPGPGPEDSSLLHKKKPLSRGPVAPAHEGSASLPEPRRSSPTDRALLSVPSKTPKLPRRPVGRERPEPAEPAHRMKPPTPKAKPRPGSHGSGEPRRDTRTPGGSQPQPGSGRLASETAITPAKPSCSGQSPAPPQPGPQAQARSCSKGPREAGSQGCQGCPGPREKKGSSEKRQRGLAPEPTRCESSGRAPLAPAKPPRAPRKQATPSRVLPARPRPGSQNGKMRTQPAEPQKGGPSHTRRKEALGQASPRPKPLPGPHETGRHAQGAEPRGCRTAEAQSDLLSQLFGQRLTSFKIPLKKVASE